MNRGKNIRKPPHDWMETLSVVHPAVPAALFVPVVLYVLTIARQFDQVTGGTMGAYFALGVVAWTLAEYLMRRVLLRHTPKRPFGKGLYRVVHGIHRDHPNDALRLVISPVVSLPLAPLVYLLWMYIAGPIVGPILFAGFVTGYLAYDYIHCWAHHGKSHTPIGQFLRRHHQLHHYYSERVNFGVSSPWWDMVFQTIEVRKMSNAKIKQAA